jgi:hypothetical protein
LGDGRGRRFHSGRQGHSHGKGKEHGQHLSAPSLRLACRLKKHWSGLRDMDPSRRQQRDADAEKGQRHPRENGASTMAKPGESAHQAQQTERERQSETRESRSIGNDS